MFDEALLRLRGMDKDGSSSYVIDRTPILRNLGLPKGGRENKSNHRGNGGDMKGFLGFN